MKRQILSILVVLAVLSINPISCQNATYFQAKDLDTNYSISSSEWFIDFCTYFGGTDYDAFYDVAIDEDGNVFVVGETYSPDFPLKNEFDSVFAVKEVVVAGFDSEGGLIFSTFFGGSDSENVFGMCLGDNDLIYIVGGTASPDLLVDETIQSGFHPPTDGFILVMDKSGNRIFSTYLGGNSTDTIRDIDVDSTGTMYIVGSSDSLDLPVTIDARDKTGDPHTDAFYAILETNQIDYLSYLGGSDGDSGRCIATNGNGLIYLAGKTSSVDFPLQDPYRDFILGTRDFFVTQLHETGYIYWSTYFGGSGDEDLEAMDIDSEENVYLTGQTLSSDFPLKNAFDNTLNGPDAFLTKIIPSNSSLAYSTYIGGSSSDKAYDIAVDDYNRAILTGYTNPTSLHDYDFPSVKEYSDEHMNWFTPFLCRFTEGGTNLEFSTKFGTSSYDYAYGVGTNDDGTKVVLVGSSESRNTSTSLLPTVNAFQPLPSTNDGEDDSYIAVFYFGEPTLTTADTSSTTFTSGTSSEPYGLGSVGIIATSMAIIGILAVFVIKRRS